MKKIFKAIRINKKLFCKYEKEFLEIESFEQKKHEEALSLEEISYYEARFLEKKEFYEALYKFIKEYYEEKHFEKNEYINSALRKMSTAILRIDAINKYFEKEKQILIDDLNKQNEKEDETAPS